MKKVICIAAAIIAAAAAIMFACFKAIQMEEDSFENWPPEED